jgi:basic amino acid/polyamine antiporter, APA family
MSTTTGIPHPPPVARPPGLLRTLGTLDLAAISLNTIIGSGIFLLPATVAATVGPWAPVSFLVSGGLSLLFALVYAEAASRFTETGGPYTYARTAFGDFVGFEVAWIFWLSRMTGVAASCNVFIAYLGHFFPEVQQDPARAGVITALVVAVMLPNLRGVRLGAFFTTMFTAAKIIPLLVLAVAGIVAVGGSRMTPLPAFSGPGFMRSMLIVAFAYGGFELATVPAGEAKDPRRQLPRALFLAIGAATVLYVIVQFTAQQLVPDLGRSVRPLADAASTAVAGGALLMTIGALISTSGYVLGGSLVIPRILFALAEHGRMPRVLARIHPRFHTPWVAIVVHAAVTWVLAAGLSFISLVLVTVLARLVVTGVTCAAVLRMRTAGAPPAMFRTPLGPVVPVAGILVILYLVVFQTTGAEAAWGVGALAVGSLLYIPIRRLMPSRAGESRSSD